MFDMVRELDLLERCASECELIARLATDKRARFENEQLALEYRQIAEVLRSTAQTNLITLADRPLTQPAKKPQEKVPLRKATQIYREGGSVIR